MHSYDKPNINIALRINVAVGICFAIFFILILRLWYLQIWQGEHFRVLSENNRRKTVFVPPPRGEIADRHGKITVQNRPAFNIEFVTEENPRPEETLEKLAEILDQPCLPKPGAKQSVQQQAAATIQFHQARQRHPGVESAIGALQSGNGLKRCRDRSEVGFDRYVALAILGRNLHTLGKLLIRQQDADCQAATSKRKRAA